MIARSVGAFLPVFALAAMAAGETIEIPHSEIQGHGSSGIIRVDQAGLPWVAIPYDRSYTFMLEGVAVARYVFDDPKITRPYFCDLRSPEGVQVSRNHPPVAGADRMDHGDYHPGVWLAFGDLSGADNWRLKAAVRHVRFVEEPVRVPFVGMRFEVENEYLDSDGAVVCRGRARHLIDRSPAGIVVAYDVTLTGDKAFTLGDQEEMGLGIRVATPLRVEKGGPNPAPEGTGEIAADGGRRGSGEIWGQPAKWIDYRGSLDGQPAGMAIFCHPGNFRASRMHARDYGFVCANPFALAAFRAGEPSTVTVEPGESLRLRWAVLCHSGRELSDEQLDAAYESYTGERF